jgi:hypothetical protein
VWCCPKYACLNYHLPHVALINDRTVRLIEDSTAIGAKLITNFTPGRVAQSSSIITFSVQLLIYQIFRLPVQYQMLTRDHMTVNLQCILGVYQPIRCSRHSGKFR